MESGILRGRTCIRAFLLPLVAALAVSMFLSASGFAATQYQQLGKTVDSSTLQHKYAYAPAIVNVDGTRHTFYCSLDPTPAGWDRIRRVTVNQDGVRLTTPVVALSTSGGDNELATCDPSIVRWQAPGDSQPYYYMFYTGNIHNAGSTIFVARSANITGPFEKWTTRDTWEASPTDPEPLIAATNPHSAVSNFYGAGQQTVIADPAGDQLMMWHQDDTTCGQNPCRKLFFRTTDDPTDWSAPPTNALVPNLEALESVDVKYDPLEEEYAMFSIGIEHGENSNLRRRVSADGTTWSAPEALCDTACFPDWTHNVGIEADGTGELASPSMVSYGAPYDLNSLYMNSCDVVREVLNICWGYWDLYSSRLTYVP